MAMKLLVLVVAALSMPSVALVTEVVKPGKKHQPHVNAENAAPAAPGHVVASSQRVAGNGSSIIRSGSSAYAPAIACGMTTPIRGVSPGSHTTLLTGKSLQECLDTCVDTSSCLGVVSHDAGDCYILDRSYDGLYSGSTGAYVANKLAGANCYETYDYLFDGCPRGHNGADDLQSSNMKIWECQAKCDSFSDCLTFETNGCSNNPNCGGNCYTFHGTNPQDIYFGGCVTGGDQKSYIKVPGAYCIKIVTGTAESSYAGRMEVYVNGTVLGETLLDKCYVTDPVVTVMNPHVNDAWLGSIEISTDAKSSYEGMSCTDCNRGTDTTEIGVDGDADASGATVCLNGATCTLVRSTLSPTASPTTAAPTGSPTASPTTASPTASPTSSPTYAAAGLIGDPHVTNLLGKRFDLRYVGNLMLLQVPRGAEENRTLLRLDGHTKRVGGLCAKELYLDQVHLTGKWVLARNGAALTIAARRNSADPKNSRHKQRFQLGGVYIALSHAQTDTGVTYMNLHVTNLSQVGMPIGGLLGEDDFSWAYSAPAACRAEEVGVHGAKGGSLLVASSL